MPSDEEIAAALAAVRCYIKQRALDDVASAAAPVRAWSAAGAFAAQGLPPTRGGMHRTWGAVERAERASRWSCGLIGL
jgi:hypothetical protein